MNIIELSVDELVPYARNAKKHDKKQIANVAESIKQFGFAQPVVVNCDNNIIIGHCRTLAAKKLGIKTIPVVRMDDLSAEEANKLRLLDNKLNESEWDFDLLAEDIPALDFSGFDIDWDLPENNDQKEVVEDDFDVELPDEPKAKRGDIYQLGRHRLMCGDSTSLKDLDMLLEGNLVDCVCTDPPYNMGYQGAGNTPEGRREKNKILNDKMPEDKFRTFLTNVYKAMYSGMKVGASCYVFYKEMGHGTFITSMMDAGLTFKQELIWVKNQLVLGGSKYQSIYEPCLLGCKGKSIKFWFGGRKQTSVIESVDFMSEEELRKTIREITEQEAVDVIRENKPLKNDLHPTMKPLKLLAKLLKNSTSAEENNKVLDLFGGSGSTLMTCEQLDLDCYTMELDEKYVDVIIERWETFTGKKAVLVRHEDAPAADSEPTAKQGAENENS